MKRLAALAMALAAAGCFSSDSSKKDTKKKAPTKTPTPVAQPAPEQPTGPIQGSETSGGKVGTQDPPKQDKPAHEKTDVPKGTGVGQRAPELALFDVDGKPFLLSEHRGKSAVLVVFGATW